jgi:hypothetical protein
VLSTSTRKTVESEVVIGRTHVIGSMPGLA